MARPSTVSLLKGLRASHDAPADDPLRRKWFEEARHRFHEVTGGRLWTKLSADVVRELLDDDEGLRDVGERDVYRAVLDWLVTNVERIPAQIDRLLGVVRFTVMSTDEKFQCLDEAKMLGLDNFVRPYIIKADWHRTCVELNFPEFSDLVEYDRKGGDQLVGEGRRVRAIEAYTNTVKSVPKNVPLVSVDKTGVDVLERVTGGHIDEGTILARPRSTPHVSISSSAESASHSGNGLTQPRRLPSEHVQFWRDEMETLAKTSDENPNDLPVKMRPVSSSGGSVSQKRRGRIRKEAAEGSSDGSKSE